MSGVGSLLARYRVRENPQRSLRRLELLVLVLLLLALLQLLWIALGSLRPASVEPVAPVVDSLRVVETASPGAVTGPMSLQFQSRPLFWASRRAEAPIFAMEDIEEGDEAPARRLEDLQLTGLIANGNQGTAIVTLKEQRLRLAVGDEIEGWSLQSVSNSEAVFVSAGARDIRRLLPQQVMAFDEAPASADPQQDAAPRRPARRAPPPADNKKGAEARLSSGG